MSLPFLLSIPHGGVTIPEEVETRLAVGFEEVAEDVDHFTREIFALPDAALTLEAEVSRSIVDLNRDPCRYPPHDPDGAVKSMTHTGHRLYGDWEIDPATIERLMERYWKPYHQRLVKAMSRPGLKLALDCHSMAAVGPPVSPDPGATRPLICLGNRHGQSAPDSWLGALAECFQEVFHLEKDQIAFNQPYPGGYITRRYAGDPLPWIQIEYSRALYLTETVYDRQNHHLDSGWARQMREKFRAVLTRLEKRLDLCAS